MTARPLLSDRGQRLPYSPHLRLPNHLRQIILPDTRRGRKATEKAKKFWIQVFRAPAGNVQTKESPNPMEPFLLVIDDRPTTKVTIMRPEGIVFARSDQFGRKLWKIAHPMPWSMRSRWIKWPTYVLAGLYSSLFTLWFFCRERVPITGRKQFRCHPLQSPSSKGNHFGGVYGGNTEKSLLAENETRVVRIRSILDQVLLASGLDPLEWTLFVLHDLDNANVLISPRGLVVCCSGLFAAAETDDEIAAAIGHQVAHVLAHHIQATESAQLLGNLALSPVLPFLLASSVFGWLRIIAAPPMAICVLILRVLSLEHEAEADRIGMLLMTEAGFDMSATVTYLEKMNNLAQERLEAQNGIQTAEYTSTNHHSAVSLSQAASQATLEIPKVLYITGKGPLHPGMSTSELRDLEEFKRRWKEFLAQRPTHDGDVDSNEYK